MADLNETGAGPDQVAGYPHPRETRALFGQLAAEQRFLSAWQDGRLHHAWLLRGPHGIGKATLAYRIARAVIARPDTGGMFGAAPVPETLDTPADCPVAKRITAQSEPSLHVIRRTPHPDTGRMRTQTTIDVVRGARRFLEHSAMDGGWRVVLVDSADDLNIAAANALLKSLEEPPARVLFLLVTHAPAALLATIRSRCRVLDLTPLGAEDLGAALTQCGATTAEDGRAALAELAGGSAGAALRLIDGNGVALFNHIVATLRGGNGVDRAAMMALAEMTTGRDAEAQYVLLLELVQTLLARLARTAAGNAPLAAPPDERALHQTLARTRHQAILWAEASGEMAARARHARAVNLDPAQTIIDTFLELDTLLARARALAA